MKKIFTNKIYYFFILFLSFLILGLTFIFSNPNLPSEKNTYSETNSYIYVHINAIYTDNVKYDGTVKSNCTPFSNSSFGSISVTYSDEWRGSDNDNDYCHYGTRPVSSSNTGDISTYFGQKRWWWGNNNFGATFTVSATPNNGYYVSNIFEGSAPSQISSGVNIRNTSTQSVSTSKTKSTKDDNSSHYYYYVIFSPKVVKLTLNVNGGSGGTREVYYRYKTSKFYTDTNCSNEISRITLPTKIGYTFNSGKGFYIENQKIVQVKENHIFVTLMLILHQIYVVIFGKIQH